MTINKIQTNSMGFETEVENDIINGHFDIWQRGASFASPDTDFTADRWKTRSSGNVGGSLTVQREIETNGDTHLSADFSGATDNWYLLQPIYEKNLLRYIDKQVYCKVVVKSDLTQDMSITLRMGGVSYYSIVVSCVAGEMTEIVLVTPVIPEVGMGVNGYLQLITTNAPLNGKIHVYSFELYPGKNERSVRRRTTEEEFRLCQSYYEKYDLYSVTYHSSSTSDIFSFPINYATHKITVPTVWFFNQYSQNVTTPTVGLISQMGCRMTCTTTAATRTTYQGTLYIDAEI